MRLRQLKSLSLAVATALSGVSAGCEGGTVEPPPPPPSTPVIVLNVSSVVVSVPVGGATTHDFEVINGTPGTTLSGLTYGIAPQVGSGTILWLAASPNTATAPVLVTLGFNAAGLSPGAYQATVRVASTNQAVVSRTLPVTMNVVASDPVGLSVASGPTDLTSGVNPSTAFRVRIVDANGNLSASTATVTAELASGSGTLAGVTSVAAVGGVATFSQLRINGRGAHTLRFVAPSLQSATTSALNVTQRVAGLAVVTQPAGATYGQPFATQPQVELRDDAGLLVAEGSATVVASRASGTGALFGETVVQAVDGTANFSSLAIEGAGPHRLSFEVGGATPGLSSEFIVAEGAPGIRLKVGDSPETNATAGVGIDLPIVLDLSNRGDDNIGSLSVRITWDPVQLVFSGNSAGDWVDGSGSTATVFVNADSTSAGVLRIGGFTTDATTASFILRRLQFSVAAGAAGRTETVAAEVTAAGNGLGVPVDVTPRSATVIVAP